MTRSIKLALLGTLAALAFGTDAKAQYFARAPYTGAVYLVRPAPAPMFPWQYDNSGYLRFLERDQTPQLYGNPYFLDRDRQPMNPARVNTELFIHNSFTNYYTDQSHMSPSWFDR